ncbi:MAG: SDR family oxidoreductase [Hellea sp.]|nr:SDR family oxidoreductase [Hellea sp.]
MRRACASKKVVKKAILITGAATRIGSHIAKGLAQDGWSVIIHYNRSEEKAETLVETISKTGGTAHAICANLAVPVELETLIERAQSMTSCPITALVNNASTFDDDRADNFTRANFDFHTNINLYAPIKLSQDFAKLRGTETGAIINIIDQRVLTPTPEYFTYRISKVALFEATRTLAQNLAPTIRVNAIGPGPTLQNKNQTTDEFEFEKNSTLLKIGSPPSSIVQGVRYLLDAQAVTGQMIVIDGGQHLSWA